MNNPDIIFSACPATTSRDRIQLYQFADERVSIHFGASVVAMNIESFEHLLFEMKAFDAERQLLNGDLNEVI